MKKTIIVTILTMLPFVFTGCSSLQPSSPKITTTKQVQIGSIDFNLHQKHQATIKYHTKEELEKLFRDELVKKLQDKNLIAKDLNADVINLKANYSRRHPGDETPFPSDALAYPIYSYNINITRSGKSLETISRDRLTYQGGFAMNLEVIATTLRDKKYEIEFIEAFVNGIVKEIENLAHPHWINQQELITQANRY